MFRPSLEQAFSKRDVVNLTLEEQADPTPTQHLDSFIVQCLDFTVDVTKCWIQIWRAIVIFHISHIMLEWVQGKFELGQRDSTVIDFQNCPFFHRVEFLDQLHRMLIDTLLHGVRLILDLLPHHAHLLLETSQFVDELFLSGRMLNIESRRTINPSPDQSVKHVFDLANIAASVGTDACSSDISRTRPVHSRNKTPELALSNEPCRIFDSNICRVRSLDCYRSVAVFYDLRTIVLFHDLWCISSTGLCCNQCNTIQKLLPLPRNPCMAWSFGWLVPPSACQSMFALRSSWLVRLNLPPEFWIVSGTGGRGTARQPSCVARIVSSMSDRTCACKVALWDRSALPDKYCIAQSLQTNTSGGTPEQPFPLIPF